MTDPTDIVTRLRGLWKDNDCTSTLMDQAADEIERLRKRLLAEENAYDIERRQNEHLQTDRNNLALEIERLRNERNAFEAERDELVRISNKLKHERDEARREILKSLHPDLRESYAAAREWDCLKENTND